MKNTIKAALNRLPTTWVSGGGAAIGSGSIAPVSHFWRKERVRIFHEAAA